MKPVFSMIALVMGMLLVVMVALADEADSPRPDDTASSRFVGSAEVVKLDNDSFVTQFRLIEELRFEESNGQVWVTPSDSILDGRSIPQLFIQQIGNLFDAGFPKTAITYDFAVKSKFHPWTSAQRMFYDGALTEGVDPVDAKVMYMLLRASGSRWAQHGPNGCFSRCHNRFKELEWRPSINEEKLISLLGWVREENPSLDTIDLRANEAIVDKGPHISGTKR